MLRTKTVVFACVSFETNKIVRPCIERKADEVHLYHYVKNPEEYRGTIYQQFYDRVEKLLRTSMKGVRIVEHVVPIYDYISVQRDIDDTIRAIRSEDPESKIYLFASAGSDEYVGAVYCAAHQFENIDILAASTKEFTVSAERIRDFYYDGDTPIGLTRETYPSKIIPIYDLSADDMNLLEAFHLYAKESDSEHPDLSYFHIYAEFMGTEQKAAFFKKAAFCYYKYWICPNNWFDIEP